MAKVTQFEQVIENLLDNPSRTIDISKATGIGRSSVGAYVMRLIEKGLGKRVDRGTYALTEAGEEQAKQIIEKKNKHRKAVKNKSVSPLDQNVKTVVQSKIDAQTLMDYINGYKKANGRLATARLLKNCLEMLEE